MKDKEPKKYVSKDDALAKLERYCAYQDRCHKEVRSKLLDLGIYGDDLEEIISDLIVNNFLNEERFARSYARGKFRIKKWGKTRIQRELKMRKISAYCLRKAMEEIEELEYDQTLRDIINKKNRTLREADPYKRRYKLVQFAIQKGYETSLAWSTVKEIFPID